MEKIKRKFDPIMRFIFSFYGGQKYLINLRKYWYELFAKN